MNPFRQVAQTFAIASLFTIVYLSVINLAGLKASLGETNYQANMIRLGDFFYGPNKDAVLVGSSIAGRILPKYFENSGLEVANLGLDGAVLLTGLEIIAERGYPTRLLLLETETIDAVQGPNDQAVVEGLSNLSFRLARWLPLLRASSRPSSIIYSKLKGWRDRSIDAEAVAGTKRQSIMLEPAKQRRGEDQVLAKQKVAIINAIRTAKASAGCIALVHIPCKGPVEDSRPPSMVDEIAEQLALPTIDVARVMASRGISAQYSDGTHLIEPSARKVAQIIAERVSKEFLERGGYIERKATY